MTTTDRHSKSLRLFTGLKNHTSKISSPKENVRFPNSNHFAVNSRSLIIRINKKLEGQLKTATEGFREFTENSHQASRTLFQKLQREKDELSDALQKIKDENFILKSQKAELEVFSEKFLGYYLIQTRSLAKHLSKVNEVACQNTTIE